MWDRRIGVAFMLGFYIFAANVCSDTYFVWLEDPYLFLGVVVVAGTIHYVMGVMW